MNATLSDDASFTLTLGKWWKGQLRARVQAPIVLTVGVARENSFLYVQQDGQQGVSIPKVNQFLFNKVNLTRIHACMQKHTNK